MKMNKISQEEHAPVKIVSRCAVFFGTRLAPKTSSRVTVHGKPIADKRWF